MWRPATGSLAANLGWCRDDQSRSQKDLGATGASQCRRVELALELETSVENEDWLVDLDPLRHQQPELSQELL